MASSWKSDNLSEGLSTFENVRYVLTQLMLLQACAQLFHKTSHVFGTTSPHFLEFVLNHLNLTCTIRNPVLEAVVLI